MASTTQYIQPKQIACIYALAKQAGMDNDDVHALIKAVIGKSSVRQLTMRQGITVIEALREKTGQPSNTRRMTREQAYKIGELQEQLGWSDERLTGFLRKRFSVGAIKWLSPGMARKVIEALKAIHAGGRAERKGPQDENTELGTGG